MITLARNADVITIRSPNLGNKDSATKTRIKKETRGGQTIVFAHPLWPKQRDIDYDFDTLDSVQVANLRRFIKIHLGQIVTLMDHHGDVHSGIITSSNIEIVEAGRFCDFSLSLKFTVVP